MRLQNRMLMFRAGRLLRSADRLRLRRLAAELATYRSEADLNDLSALLDSYPDGQTQEIRQILGQQQVHRAWTGGRAG
jgi:hypothetical protein